jgi:hypothetical protein
LFKLARRVMVQKPGRAAKPVVVACVKAEHRIGVALTGLVRVFRLPFRLVVT